MLPAGLSLFEQYRLRYVRLGAFRKNIHNWQTIKQTLLDSARTAAESGFEPRYINCQVSTLLPRV